MAITPRRNQPRERAVHQLLRPIVRFALRRTLYFQDVMEILKGVFVEVAEEEILKKEARVNVSQLAVATGLTRREVSIFLVPGTPAPEIQSFLARIVGQWESDKRFRTKKNEPRILCFGEEGSEFVELVRSVSSHVGPKAVLSELVRNGAVELTSNGAKLIRRTIDFTADEVKAIGIIAKDIDDLVVTLEHNLRSEIEDQNLHMRTSFDNIYEDAIPSIRKWLIREGKAFHARAREMLAKHDADVNPTSGAKKLSGSRVMLTSYSFAESGLAEAARSATPQKSKKKSRRRDP